MKDPIIFAALNQHAASHTTSAEVHMTIIGSICHVPIWQLTKAVMQIYSNYALEDCALRNEKQQIVKTAD